MKFKQVKIEDVADVTKLAGFEFTKYIKYNETGEIIALRAINIRNNTLDLTDIKRIDKSVSESLIRSKLYKDDIILTYTGNGAGAAAIIDENDKYHLAPNICKITPKEINPYYLYKYITSNKFQKEISNNIGGSGQPTIPMKTIRVLPISVPSRCNQTKIAKILKNIDDKIKLNNEINNNLHELMKIKFNNCIDNLEEYEESVLSKIANYKNGLAMQKFRPIDESGLPVIKIKEMNSGITSETERCRSDIDSDVIIDNGDILFAWSGTLCMSIWCGGRAGLNQHIFKVTSDKYPKWFYYFWTSKHLDNFIEIAAGKATTMGHIKRTELDKAIVKIPNEKIMEKMDKIFTPMFNEYVNNSIESKNLSELRDTLLPKLMNGGIDLDNIEI